MTDLQVTQVQVVGSAQHKAMSAPGAKSTRSTRRRDQVAAKGRLQKSVCGIQVAVLRRIGLARRSRRRCLAWHPLDKSIVGARGRRVTAIRAFATSEFERQALDLDH
jgi:hypothetical protein